ncbi:MAG: shikimate dehydrogenase family protein [Christensenellales bacterium]
MGVKHNIDTKKYYQIGKPLGHSMTGKLYNALIKEYDLNAVFLLLELTEEEFPAFMKNLKAYHVAGIGVTMPYKTKIGAYLDKLEKNCEIFGCVNNVAIDDEGKTHGYAQDGVGMCNALEDVGGKISKNKVLVLGAGGVSGVVAAELANRGAKEIIIANRTVSKAEEIAQKIIKHYNTPAKAISFTPQALDEAAAQCMAVMQCTSLGMHGVKEDFEYLGFVDKLPKGAAVADVTYNPDPTSFIAKARQSGIANANGMPMLANQMVLMFRNVLHCELGEKGPKVAMQFLKDAMAGKLYND